MEYIALGRWIYAVAGTAQIEGAPRGLLHPVTRQITVGVPPYYRVTGVNEDGSLLLQELYENSPEYLRVRKWAEEHTRGHGAHGRLRLNNGPRPTEEHVRSMLLQSARA